MNSEPDCGTYIQPLMRPSTRALMTFARTSLVGLSVLEPPCRPSGLSRGGPTCFLQLHALAILVSSTLLSNTARGRSWDLRLRQAAASAAPADRYSVPLVSIAQAMRACLAASATAATFTCRRSPNAVPKRFSHRSFCRPLDGTMEGCWRYSCRGRRAICADSCCAQRCRLQSKW